MMENGDEELYLLLSSNYPPPLLGASPREELVERESSSQPVSKEIRPVTWWCCNALPPPDEPGCAAAWCWLRAASQPARSRLVAPCLLENDNQLALPDWLPVGGTMLSIS